MDKFKVVVGIAMGIVIIISLIYLSMHPVDYKPAIRIQISPETAQ